jgi:formate hydrogenlyase subunit 4
MLPGIINKTKAVAAGRKGPPLLQLYYDLEKLCRKGSVYSETTSFIFVAGPIISLAACLTILALIPFGSTASILSFSGDFVLIIYLFGLVRFFTVLAALDTGSSFEGMGASREMFFSALAEPAMLLAMATLAHQSNSLSLTEMLGGINTETWFAHALPLIFVISGLFIVYLCENCRIPVDDPNTHLELTMIHEVMVLDHSGVDFAFIEYTAALKLWILGAIISALAIPVRSGNPLIDCTAILLGIFALAVLVGVVESSMARLRLLKVPQLLLSSSACMIVAFLLL